MLSFQEKLDILSSFPELTRNDVSMGRVNFHFEGSQHEKKTVGYRLHPNGSGYIYAGLLKGYDTDDKGYASIRDLNEEQLRELAAASIESLSAPPSGPAREPGQSRAARKRRMARTAWVSPEGDELELRCEDDLWYLYAGLSLEMAFETFEEAEEYLQEEGFQPKA
ncbi:MULTISPECIES: hypothetical protein [unclassified Paenibacillus]|uniref:hypothetical protein n=1 Tax=unclassified Paenibacillus TaxID=185978 RepID=UPI000956ED10|nr:MULTISPECIES: hypothetical protein [unclassified Paenibacillus]ASS68947.1 hypothetical protein CIC07_24610 [Paenibacillus sp. RUD330]SIR13663.1 hypothetical protein SAMN05880555_3102 [Paenibacillus sp. RU4X]SIR24020.1 hypothetical protein SAMN05880570_2895 [Paenibacillus sp. RU4T]